MNFHEVRFPANLSFGSVGGPERRTDVVTLANGFEERNTPWAHSRRRYDAGVSMRSLDDIETLIAFFLKRAVGKCLVFAGRTGLISGLVWPAVSWRLTIKISRSAMRRHQRFN